VIETPRVPRGTGLSIRTIPRCKVRIPNPFLLETRKGATKRNQEKRKDRRFKHQSTVSKGRPKKLKLGQPKQPSEKKLGTRSYGNRHSVQWKKSVMVLPAR